MAESPQICQKCGNSKFTCTPQYSTTGGDLEHVEWTHSCNICGYTVKHEEVSEGCYGVDHEYPCPFPGCPGVYKS